MPTPTTPGCASSCPDTGRRSRWWRSAGSAGASRRPTPTSTSCCCTRASVDGLADLADAIWYPIWDSGIGLDHSVRTPDEAVAVAKDDLKALLGLLDIRHIAGDAGLTGRVRSTVLDVWRASAAKRLDETAGDLARALGGRRRGGVPARAEPQGVARRPARRAGAARPRRRRSSSTTRCGCARPTRCCSTSAASCTASTGRAEDVLRQQEHDGVAAALGYVDTDADGEARDALLRRVNEAARAIAHALDLAWRRVEARAASHAGGAGCSARPRPVGPQRVGLAKDVVAQDGEVVLARDADPWADPGWCCGWPGRPPSTTCRSRRSPSSGWPRSRRRCPTPWPKPALDDFARRARHRATGRPRARVARPGRAARARSSPSGTPCAAGPSTTRCTASPSTGTCSRPRPPRPSTTARSRAATCCSSARCCTTSARAIPAATTRSSGPSTPRPIARRMGYDGDDLAMIVGLVRHHLLLPNTATRRDLDDPMTITIVRESVGGLGRAARPAARAGPIADAAATGPAAWSDWKGRPDRRPGRAARAPRWTARALPAVAPLDDERRALAEAGELAVRHPRRRGDRRRPGRHRHAVPHRRACSPCTRSTSARRRSARTPAWPSTASSSSRASAGCPTRRSCAAIWPGRWRASSGWPTSCAEKERVYSRRPAGAPRRRPSVHWFDDATDATVVEFRGEDEIGLLSRITAALERAGLDVRSARVSSVAGVGRRRVLRDRRATGEPGRRRAPGPASSRTCRRPFRA